MDSWLNDFDCINFICAVIVWNPLFLYSCCRIVGTIHTNASVCKCIYLMRLYTLHCLVWFSWNLLVVVDVFI